MRIVKVDFVNLKRILFAFSFFLFIHIDCVCVCEYMGARGGSCTCGVGGQLWVPSAGALSSLL